MDAFASAPNAVCPVFFSRFDSVGTSGVDFFNQCLSPSDFYYLCPPILKAVSVVKHMFYHRAKGVLVYPIWPTHISFNFFWPDGCHFANWASNLLIFSPSYVGGLVVSTCFCGPQPFLAFAAEIDFIQSNSCKYI